MRGKCFIEVHRGPQFLLGTGYVRALLLQSCLTLCNPMDHSLPGYGPWDCKESMDHSLPGSFIHGVFQARILEWVAVFLLQGIFPTQGLNLDSFTTESPGKAA